ncbi:hypothetical protein STAL104432_03925 [Streptomyces albus]
MRSARIDTEAGWLRSVGEGRHCPASAPSRREQIIPCSIRNALACSASLMPASILTSTARTAADASRGVPLASVEVTVTLLARRSHVRRVRHPSAGHRIGVDLRWLTRCERERQYSRRRCPDLDRETRCSCSALKAPSLSPPPRPRQPGPPRRRSEGRFAHGGRGGATRDWNHPRRPCQRTTSPENTRSETLPAVRCQRAALAPSPVLTLDPSKEAHLPKAALRSARVNCSDPSGARRHERVDRRRRPDVPANRGSRDSDAVSYFVQRRARRRHSGFGLSRACQE